jgi:hypothetical protein
MDAFAEGDLVSVGPAGLAWKIIALFPERDRAIIKSVGESWVGIRNVPITKLVPFPRMDDVVQGLSYPSPLD